MCFIQFLNDNSGAIIAIATVVLAGITIIYVLLTKSISSSSKKQVEMLKEQHEHENRPWIYISNLTRTEINSLDYKFSNCGKAPGFVTRGYFKLYHKDATIEEKNIRKMIIFPDQEVTCTIIFNKEFVEGYKDGLFTALMVIPYYSIHDKKCEHEHKFSQSNDVSTHLTDSVILDIEAE